MVYVQDIGTYHLANAKYILRCGKYPALLLPEWSLKPYAPFSPEEHFKETEKKQELALPQKVIINAMKMAQLKPAGAFKGKTVLWLFIIGAVVLYLITKIIGR
jgi:hypothetical protein